MTDYSIPTLTFEGLSTWEEAQRKVQAILTSHRWECSDVITRDSILSLWGNGQTFGCRIQCDKDNNPKEVIEIPDLIVDLYQDETGMHVQFSLMDTWRADRGDQ